MWYINDKNYIVDLDISMTVIETICLQFSKTP